MNPHSYRFQLLLLWLGLPLVLGIYRLILDGPAIPRWGRGLLLLVAFNIAGTIILALPALWRAWRNIGNDLVADIPDMPLPSPVGFLWAVTPLATALIFTLLYPTRLRKWLRPEMIFSIGALKAFCLQSVIHSKIKDW